MCQEHITIALCAPSKAPSLSFTCGKFHMVAEQRHICNRARGPCMCFFGTCGVIEKNVGVSGIDLSTVRKVRCAECTVREDNVGDRRTPKEIIESPLLQHIPIDPKDTFVTKKHTAMLHELWGNTSTCPYHVQPAMAIQSPVSTAKVETKQSNGRPTTPKTIEEPASKSPTMSHDTVDDGWSAPIASSSQRDKLSRKSSASPTGIASLDSTVGLKSSRWAPKASEQPVQRPAKQQPAPLQTQKRSSPPQVFVPGAGNASKVRDATKKMANVKGFLTGARVV
ncbi:hypothetical protein N0V84_006707 [Fusarium piperis]|uniref:Uncharacterized protein n=1 Tax=Fusarium piperis TaxID=1435070 RepID=A0A9W8WBI8_9HYPO|nr:hypothetical protein N0V84_006707 [Fusarium piperis]